MTPNRRTRNERHAFTLVELLVVIMIVAVLGSMIFAGLIEARRTALATACRSNLGQIYRATILYAGAEQNQAPFLEQNGIPWYLALQQAAGQGESFGRLFVCPAQPQSGYNAADLAWTNNHVSYGINGDVKLADGTAREAGDGHWPGTAADQLADQYSLSEIVMPGEFVRMGESAGGGVDTCRVAPGAIRTDRAIGMWHRSKGNVLFADGSVDARDQGINSIGNDTTTLWTLPAD